MQVEKSRYNYAQRRFLRVPSLFLISGSTALLLAISHLIPELFILSFAAFIPFLWQVLRSDYFDAILLGLLLALCYVGAVSTQELLIAPMTFIIKLLFLGIVFSVFGLSLGLIKKFIWPNPLVVALAWLPQELFIEKFSPVGSVFFPQNNGSVMIISLSTLFGLVVFAVGVILLNAILLEFLHYIFNKSSEKKKHLKDVAFHFYRYKKIVFISRVLIFRCSPRSPPRQAHHLIY
ncbi:MAG: hypothetical protein CVT49_04475 [candidate division Zixibacteria bacterium HGW-Zixibacteria-1]|nr:MAG: hypothetical protein CVT49_04475 [candidate division Zixibacteria bacterium HGW-Zixibacteria-1]